MLVDLFGDPIYREFARLRPIAVMSQLTVRHVLDEAALQQVFEEHALSQYEGKIPFASLTRMLASVVLCQERSVNSGIRKMQEELGASHQAIYGKLQRVELSTLRGLVQYSWKQVLAAQTVFGLRPRRELAGWETLILDGNHLAATEHRLKETRNSTAAPLPGKVLVVYSPRRDAITDCFPLADGHAQERSGLDDVLATIRPRQLWVADRNFCTLKFLYGIADARAAFLIRQHGQIEGTPLEKLRRIGKSDTGIVYEQKYQLPEYQGQTLVVRRVMVELKSPTRDGDKQIYLLTNLPAEDADALEVAEQYRGRWQIETVMQRLTESFRCEIRPLCYPQAALFGFAIALVMYNAVSILLSAINAVHGPETSDTLSHYYVAMEISQTTEGMLIALKPSRWGCVAKLTPERFAAEMKSVAQGMNLKYYAKSTRSPKKPKPKPTHVRNKVHVSTKKLLDEREK